MELKQDEKIEYDIGANLKRGIEAVGGKLKFSNQRMYFKPHALNVQKKELSITYDEVESVLQAKSLGVIPNGLKITLKSGEEFKFVLGKRKEIMEFIESKMKGH